MEKLSSKFTLALKGMAMGIAEVIPGVSGGTIAFITGIYEELIDTIKVALSPEWIKAFRKGGISAAWEKINGTFLLFLLGGMVVGIVAGIFGVSHLFENYPILLWSFFFGLIIASAIYIGRQVSKWGAAEIVGLLVGIVVAYYITIASPSQGTEALWFVFLSGAIAISALILPGISGSFILLLMGMYTVVIPTIKHFLENFDTPSLVIIVVFGLGCLVGLATFARVLSWTFKNYKNLTLAILTGFMIGSLNKVWPWRKVLSYRENSKGEQVPFIEESILPSQFEGDSMLVGAIIMMIVGFVVVFALERLDQREEPETN